jgi:hypothetical protein
VLASMTSIAFFICVLFQQQQAPGLYGSAKSPKPGIKFCNILPQKGISLAARKNHDFDGISLAALKNHEFDPIPRLEDMLLYQGIPCDSVDAFDLVKSLRANNDDKIAALDALRCPVEASVVTISSVLTAQACAKLRQFADEHSANSSTVDAMDGELEWRVELDKNGLESLIGVDAVQTIWNLPALLDARRRASADSSSTIGLASGGQPAIWLGGAVLRRYSSAVGARTSLGFHVDSSDCTANVCLSPPTAHTGGALFLAAGKRIVEASRREGDAIVHSGDVAHGVGRVTSGVRHSLLVFFQRPGYLFQSFRGRRRTPASPPS